MRLRLDVGVVARHGRVGVPEGLAADLGIDRGIPRQAGRAVPALMQLDHRQARQRGEPPEPPGQAAVFDVCRRVFEATSTAAGGEDGQPFTWAEALKCIESGRKFVGSEMAQEAALGASAAPWTQGTAAQPRPGTCRVADLGGNLWHLGSPRPGSAHTPESSRCSIGAMGRAVVLGDDGKGYPLHPLSERERDRVVALTHRLRCEGLLSVREGARRLEEHGVRRSVGPVARDLRLYTCLDVKPRLTAERGRN